MVMNLKVMVSKKLTGSRLHCFSSQRTCEYLVPPSAKWHCFSSSYRADPFASVNSSIMASFRCSTKKIVVLSFDSLCMHNIYSKSMNFTKIIRIESHGFLA